MSPVNDREKLALKLAQLKLYNGSVKFGYDKNIELLLQELDLNVKVPKTKYLQDNDNDIMGHSLLHLAYSENNFELYEILMSKGADYSMKDKEGNTVVHKAFHQFCIRYHNTARKNPELMNNVKRFITPALLAHVKSKNIDNPSDSNGLTYFHIACGTNNVEAVEFFLKNGVSVNQTVTCVGKKKYFKEYTLLHFAAEFGFVEVAEILLKYGANTHLENSEGQMPLHIAMERNIEILDSELQRDIDRNEQLITLLLKHTINPKLSPFIVASARMYSYHLGSFLDKGLNLNECISMDSKVWPGYTALHFAAYVNIDKVKLLMKHGANILAKEGNGVTPFDMCIDRYKVEDIVDIINLVPAWKDIVMSDGRTKLVNLLLTFKTTDGISNFLKESKDNIKLYVPVNSPLWPGFTIIHLAVLMTERKKCKTDYKVEESKKNKSFQPELSIITECLKQNNADVTISNENKQTPIHLAFRLEKKNTLNLLLQHHHRIKNCTDQQNLSHLHIACAVENVDLVQKLVWNEADVNIVYEGDEPVTCVYPGWTPLHIAIYKHNTSIVQLLLQFNADIYISDTCGFTPIHNLMPCYYLKKLGKIAFDVPNLRDFINTDVGLSYLHIACAIPDLDAVKRLLDLGADVNKSITCTVQKTVKNYPSLFDFENYIGGTPLHFVMVHYSDDRPELVKLLIERGADLFAKRSEKNMTPLTTILDNGDSDVVDVIVDVLKGNVDLQKRIEKETGITMLHIACCRVNLDLIKEVLDDGANVNAQVYENSPIWQKFTALHVLMDTYEEWIGDDEGMRDTMKLLIERNADVTVSNNKGDTPVHVAYRELYLRLNDPSLNDIILLVKAQKNFDVNPASVEGLTHFHIACHVLEVDTVEAFLEHNVDVNSRIDPFCDFEIAAKIPLHLAVESIRDLSEIDETNPFLKFAQWKIVDLLIKNEADVNAEDVFGNTPAHYLGFRVGLDEDILERLVNGGANVNVRNVQGETMLERLMKRKNFDLQEISMCIKCGCRFNEFNRVTGKGYIALDDCVIKHKDMQALLFGAFVNSPDSVKMDDTKRTVIHNLVSNNNPSSDKAMYAELFDLLMTLGCDIDDQDALGKTALHLAAHFRNEPAVAALIEAGADINITDHNDKTPFAYILEPCSQCSSENDKKHDQFSHSNLFKTFMSHIKKMELNGIFVNSSNELIMNKALQRFSVDDIMNELNDIFHELAQITKLKIEPYSLSAANFLWNAAVLEYPTMSLSKRKVVDAFFREKKRSFQNDFKQTAALIQLQYRQALLRRKIINKAIESICALAKCRVPDICSHIILRSLKNFDLQNLIISTTNVELSNTHVKSLYTCKKLKL